MYFFSYLSSHVPYEWEKVHLYYSRMNDLASSWRVYLPHQCPVPVSRLSFHRRLYILLSSQFFLINISKKIMTLSLGSRYYSHAHSSLIIAIGKFAELSHSHIILAHMTVTYWDASNISHIMFLKIFFIDLDLYNH